jgi:hypothetical protein
MIIRVDERPFSAANQVMWKTGGKQSKTETTEWEKAHNNDGDRIEIPGALSDERQQQEDKPRSTTTRRRSATSII